MSSLQIGVLAYCASGATFNFCFQFFSQYKASPSRAQQSGQTRLISNKSRKIAKMIGGSREQGDRDLEVQSSEGSWTGGAAASKGMASSLGF